MNMNFETKIDNLNYLLFMSNSMDNGKSKSNLECEHTTQDAETEKNK